MPFYPVPGMLPVIVPGRQFFAWLARLRRSEASPTHAASPVTLCCPVHNADSYAAALRVGSFG